MADEERKLKQEETASLVCGILSIIFYFFSSGFIALILGIIAVIFGNRCRKAGGSVAGFVCGIIGLCLGILMVIESLMILAGLRPFINTVFDLFTHSRAHMRLI